MNKLFNLCLLAAAVMSANAFAAPANKLDKNQNLAGYFSKQHPMSVNGNVKAAFNAAMSKSAMIAPTDIIINNATFNPIYANVPEGGFTDTVAYHFYDHIFNMRGAYYTKITLYDPNSVPFFTQVLCPRASLTVYGYTPYDVVVDIESCKR